MPFKPGLSGNPDGRPKKGTSLTELMREYLEEVPEEIIIGGAKVQNKKRITNKEIFIRACVSYALKGDDAFARFVWGYLEGDPKKEIKATVSEITANVPLTDKQSKSFRDKFKIFMLENA